MRTVVDQMPGLRSVIALNTDGSLTTGTVQDCTPIVDYAKARHNEGLHGSADMRLAASVPMVIVERYCNDNGITFQDFSKSQDHKSRLLNDPTFSHFRIWKGKV